MMSGPGTRFGPSGAPPPRAGMTDDCGCTIYDGGDFDRIHGRRDRNFPDDQPGVRRPPQLVRQLFGNQKPSAIDAERTRGGIVLIEISFDVEKDKARFPVADDQFKCSPEGVLSMMSWLADAFNGSGRTAGVSPDQTHRARLGGRAGHR